MNRRQFVLSSTAVASGGSIVIGSGAFSFVRADRPVSIEVADDGEAYLGLRPSEEPNGAYATMDDGTLGIDLTSENPTEAGGTGVNDDAVTYIFDTFEIVNQGTQPVTVYYESDAIGYEENEPPAAVELTVTQPSMSSFELEVLNPDLLVIGDGPDPRTAFNPQMSLEPGEHISVGLVIDAAETDGVDGTFTISARAEDSY